MVEEKDIVKLDAYFNDVYPYLAGKECEVVRVCVEEPSDEHVGYVRIVGKTKEYRVELVKFTKV